MQVVWVSVASLAFGAIEPMEPEDIAQQFTVGNPTLKLRKMVEPVYPEAALESGISGTVVVEVFIDKLGVPQAFHAVRGNAILTNAAFKAVQHWRWQPYRLKREAIPVEMTLAIHFEPW